MLSSQQVLLKKLKAATLQNFEDHESIFVPQGAMLLDDFERSQMVSHHSKSIFGVKKDLGASEQTEFNIVDNIEKIFIPSDIYSILLVTGDAGSGKSTLSNQIVRSIWKKIDAADEKEKYPCPIHIQLLGVNYNEPDILWSHLIGGIIKFTGDQVAELQRLKLPLILVLDGFDEVESSVRSNIIRKIMDTHWPNKLKIIITSKRIGGNLTEEFYVSGSKLKGKVLKYHILPFSHDQIDQYLLNYVNNQIAQVQPYLRPILQELLVASSAESINHISNCILSYYLWTKEKYHREINNIPEADSLIKNPYVLSQVVEVLSSISADHNDEKKQVEQIQFTRQEIYDRFTQQYFKRQLKLLPRKYDEAKDFDENLDSLKKNHNLLTVSDREELFVSLFQIYTKNLAYDLFIRQQNSVSFVNYMLLPMPVDIKELQQGIVYIQQDEKNGWNYSVKTPTGIDYWRQPFFLPDMPKSFDQLNCSEILKITTKNGHTDWWWSRKYFDVNDKTSPYYPYVELIRSGCPLRALGNNRFTLMHQSLIEFFAANYLFNSVLAKGWIMTGINLNSSFLQNKTLFISDDQTSQIEKLPEVKTTTCSALELKDDLHIEMLSLARTDSKNEIKRTTTAKNNEKDTSIVMNFLADYAKTNSEFRDTLLEIVYISRHVPHIWRAAANATTILNKAGFVFSGLNFRGIRIGGMEEDGTYWGADMSKSLCHGTDFGGADVRGVNFTEAWLADTNFSDSYMNDTIFGELAYLKGDRVFYSANKKQLIIFDFTYYQNYQLDYYFNFELNTYNLEHTLVNSTQIKSVTSAYCYCSVDFELAFSPNLQQLAWTKSGSKVIHLHSAITAQKERVLEGHTAKIRTFLYQPNGKLLASGSNDCSIILWKIGDGQIWRLLLGHECSVVSLSFSPNSLQLASGSMDKTIRIWDVLRGVCLQTLEVGSTITCLKHQPLGDGLASGNKEGEIYLWSLKISNQPRQILRGHTGEITTLSYREDGLELASGAKDQTIRRWTENGKCLQILEGHTGSINGLFYQNNRLLSSGGKTIRTWLLSELNSPPDVSRSLVHHCPITDMRYRFDGKEIATAARNDSIIRLWNVSTGKCKKELKGHTGEVNCLSYKPNSLQLASGSADGTLRFWLVDSGECLRVIKVQYAEIVRDIRCIDFRPDGEELVIGFNDVFILWSLTANKITREFVQTNRLERPVIKNAITARYRPDGKVLATGKEGGLYGYFRAPTIKRSHDVYKVGLSIEYLTGLIDQDVKLYEGERLGDLLPYTVTCVSYRPDAKQLAVGYEHKNMVIYSHCKEKQQILTQADSLDFSPDNTFLASADKEEKTINIWSTENFNCKHIFKFKHPNGIESMKWSPVHEKKDQNLTYSLISGNSEGSVRLWQLKVSKTKRDAGLKVKAKLLWQTHSLLFSQGAVFMHATKLDTTDYALLLQRGATEAKPNETFHKTKDPYQWHPTGIIQWENGGKVIDKDHWVIILARKKSNSSNSMDISCHAKLVIYGIEFDSRLKQHYVVTKEIHFSKGDDNNARIQIRDVIEEEIIMEKNNLIQKSFNVSRSTIDKLIINVVRDQRNGKKYLFPGSTMFRNHYNCLSYCEAKLTEVELSPNTIKWSDFLFVIPTHHLPNPEKNTTCTIM